ncbi:MAG: Fe-S protein assembly co-chaperone HscB [Myxococcaceae bacterium]|nr:MAG: Fe-S protein assembly co-chaperone HscB [Myxococcaceae bacterium]
MRCWSCQSEVGAADVCPSCGKVQLVAPGTTLFDVLGLPRGVDVDKAELERAYRERSLRLHPDRAGKDDPRERRLSLERTALLNEAYKTLRAPEPRAFYLLKLHGLDLLKEEARAVSIPPKVLEEVLQLREQLESARESGDDEQVSALSDRVRVQSATTLSAAQSALRRLEQAPADEAVRVEAAQALARLRYHHRFLEAAEGSDEEDS